MPEGSAIIECLVLWPVTSVSKVDRAAMTDGWAITGGWSKSGSCRQPQWSPRQTQRQGCKAPAQTRLAAIHSGLLAYLLFPFSFSQSEMPCIRCDFQPGRLSEFSGSVDPSSITTSLCAAMITGSRPHLHQIRKVLPNILSHRVEIMVSSGVSLFSVAMQALRNRSISSSNLKHIRYHRSK